MNKLLPILIAVAGLVPAACLGQILTSGGKASDQTNIAIHKLDILVKIVPLALRKEQFPELLVAIENARDLQKEELSQEDKDLASIDPDVTKAVTDGVEKGVYPAHTIQDEVVKLFGKINSRQITVGVKMVKLVSAAVDSKFNEGQKKTMAGSFVSSYINPKVKPEDVTDAIKIDFFIKNVLLDPLCYDLLVEMSKHAS